MADYPIWVLELARASGSPPGFLAEVPPRPGDWSRPDPGVAA